MDFKEEIASKAAGVRCRSPFQGRWYKEKEGAKYLRSNTASSKGTESRTD